MKRGKKVRKPKKRMAGRPRGGATLQCPKCGNVSGVTLTRRVEGLVYRQRVCKKCKHEFNSVEQVKAA
jgi:hypothetical protein